MPRALQRAVQGHHQACPVGSERKPVDGLQAYYKEIATSFSLLTALHTWKITASQLSCNIFSLSFYIKGASSISPVGDKGLCRHAEKFWSAYGVRSPSETRASSWLHVNCWSVQPQQHSTADLIRKQSREQHSRRQRHGSSLWPSGVITHSHHGGAHSNPSCSAVPGLCGCEGRRHSSSRRWKKNTTLFCTRHSICML